MTDRSMTAGYRALREGAAWLDLSARGKIYATGEDRARLLHAMTTNHVEQLKPGQGCYVFFLTAQGRIVADANLYCFEDRFLLDVEPETRHTLYQHLDKFIIADDVTLEDATENVSTISLEGPQAASVLTAAGAPVPAASFDHTAWNERIVARGGVTGALGFRVFARREEFDALTDHLEAAGAVKAEAEDARIVRIENGVPRYGEDIFDLTLPLETQQQHALHFNKGCYIGQEIVERVRSRGHVNRLLVGLEIDATEPPPPGTLLTAGDAEVGKLASAIFSPALGKVAALAYVRTTHASPGTELAVAGVRAVTKAPANAPARTSGR